MYLNKQKPTDSVADPSGKILAIVPPRTYGLGDRFYQPTAIYQTTINQFLEGKSRSVSGAKPGHILPSNTLNCIKFALNFIKMRWRGLRL